MIYRRGKTFLIWGGPRNSWREPVWLGQQAGTSSWPYLSMTCSGDPLSQCAQGWEVSLHTALSVLKLRKFQANWESWSPQRGRKSLPQNKTQVTAGWLWYICEPQAPIRDHTKKQWDLVAQSFARQGAAWDWVNFLMQKAELILTPRKK